MSWLFGYKSQVPNQAAGQGLDVGQPAQPQTAGDQSLTSAQKKAMEAYRFDSSALERAAEAARTLEKSSKCDLTLNANNYLLHHHLIIFFHPF